MMRLSPYCESIKYGLIFNKPLRWLDKSSLMSSTEGSDCSAVSSELTAIGLVNSKF